MVERTEISSKDLTKKSIKQQKTNEFLNLKKNVIRYSPIIPFHYFWRGNNAFESR